jgi:hypothetical protein
MAHWICSKCGNEVMTMSDNPPLPLNWSDGHKCWHIRLDTLKAEDQDKLVKSIEENL